MQLQAEAAWRSLGPRKVTRRQHRASAGGGTSVMGRFRESAALTRSLRSSSSLSSSDDIGCVERRTANGRVPCVDKVDDRLSSHDALDSQDRIYRSFLQDFLRCEPRCACFGRQDPTPVFASLRTKLQKLICQLLKLVNLTHVKLTLSKVTQEDHKNLKDLKDLVPPFSHSLRAICTVLLDRRDPLLHSERVQGFTADPVYGRAKCLPMLGSLKT